MDRSTRRFVVRLGIGMIGIGSLQLAVPQNGRHAPSGVSVAGSSRGLDEVRGASAAWERRPGPARQVVDLVCLVPDVATFFEAIATWDESHAFPILIDDVELTFKFLRAFRPARIVRYPRKAAPIPAERTWDAAVAAVGRSWSGSGSGASAGLPGDEVPRRLGPTPPGVVLSSPSSPMLAGAVALAAGRFQPLVRWDIPRHYADAPSRDEAEDLAARLEATVADRIPDHGNLGDDCDFLTLAGDWPYRYQDRDGPGAFDDLVGRSNDGARWAFTGRLLGDPAASVYRAMCSLFLQPESALLFNTYTDPGRPWADFALSGAADRLARFAAVTLREGNRASLSEWSRLFDPINRFGLVLINTHGFPTVFFLPGGPGLTGDVPPSMPAAVLMIHSFSATDPNDPGTIAGRWLANGAFAYFGALNEPFLQGFRPPEQVAGLVAEGLPLGAACRRNPPEPYGQPWRLVYLGDPLYRLLPRDRRPPRLDRWGPVSSWPAYGDLPPPVAGATEADRLTWALKTALVRLQGATRPQTRPDPLLAALLAIRRERLDARLRPVHDALLVDTLLQAGRPNVLLDRLSRIPVADRSPVARRTLESLQRRWGLGPGG